MGLPVDVISRAQTVERIGEWIRVPGSKPKIVVTAYSEFYVNAQKDIEFASIIKHADLITPDGVSVLAAVEYAARTGRLPRREYTPRNDDWFGIRVLKNFFEGMKVGGKIISGKMGETITGVWMFDTLTKLASQKGWKVFLLGGWGDVGERTTKMLLERSPNIKVMCDSGELSVGTDSVTNERVIKKINAYKPDLLFVQYRPVVQEKWIATNLSRLKVGVVMGVGGTFDEFVGDFKKAPVVMETMGLKWLWRLMVQPKRFKRIIKAVIIFPWLVFKKSLEL